MFKIEKQYMQYALKMDNGDVYRFDTLEDATLKVEKLLEAKGSVVLDEPLPQYNDGFTQEALHLAYVLIDTWQRHIAESRCADEFPDVKVAAEKVTEAMGDLYQLIGQKAK